MSLYGSPRGARSGGAASPLRAPSLSARHAGLERLGECQRKRVAPGARSAATGHDILELGEARQRILAGYQPKRRRNLTPPHDAQLAAEYVAMGFRRSRGNAETASYLVVRASGGDQLDDLSLTNREPRILRFHCNSSFGVFASLARRPCGPLDDC